MLDIELEKQRCSQDFIYFVETYCKIQSPNKGIDKLSLNDVQKRYFKDFQSNKFNLILKQRQVGASTLLCAYVIWKSLFNDDQKFIVMSTGYSAARSILDKFTIMLFDLPIWCRAVLSKPIKINNNKYRSLFINEKSINYIDFCASTCNNKEQDENFSLVIFDEAFYMSNLLSLEFLIKKSQQTIIISTENINSKSMIDRILLVQHNKCQQGEIN